MSSHETEIMADTFDYQVMHDHAVAQMDAYHQQSGGEYDSRGIVHTKEVDTILRVVSELDPKQTVEIEAMLRQDGYSCEEVIALLCDRFGHTAAYLVQKELSEAINLLTAKNTGKEKHPGFIGKENLRYLGRSGMLIASKALSTLRDMR